MFGMNSNGVQQTNSLLTSTSNNNAFANNRLESSNEMIKLENQNTSNFNPIIDEETRPDFYDDMFS
jgi:hypothetical protein